jgi:hypothetical protein
VVIPAIVAWDVEDILVIENIMKEQNIDVDVLDFASSLLNDLQFVLIVNGQVVNDIVKNDGHFQWISKKTAALFFNKYMFGLYYLSLLTGVFFCFIVKS